ncbi:MAG: zinc-dependent alcohol dehydrogenase family protein [Phaeodactylibacter sp.]|nr:zinc-dependent alcohol dehydrogenase family protein [Phaeodactylibacter sp.]MCB9304411.1 zinc-dependent alcohol dehydrogenase family protein [Lewinellaceae bacterium]
MKALILTKLTNIHENPEPLKLAELPIPEPGAGQIQLKVHVCGVCHTELDEIEGRTPPPELPVVLGHQAVGEVVKLGEGCRQLNLGERVGVAWIYSACGVCEYCRSGQENLCEQFRATGRDANGGYAEYMVVPEAFAHPIPAVFKDAEAAPLLCAGAIGYRSVRLANMQDGHSLGLAGFGGSGHLVLKMVRYQFPNTKVFVFARSSEERAFALELGAAWAGDTADSPPEKLDAIIDTTPVWKPVVEGLRALKPGGRLVVNAIRKEDVDKGYLLQLDYPEHLWLEKEVKSVANVTRQDVREFLELAAKIPIRPEYQEYPLEAANEALYELKTQRIRGAKVLRVG